MVLTLVQCKLII
uniref:Uncharacterized protein n=1 Tax=Rhizophora mucronata TaxID=61149 RepID=A0A2P2R542_RHIMU